MRSVSYQTNSELISKFTDQPAVLPTEVRDQIESLWKEPVQLYALADLDASLKFQQTWVAVGPTKIAIAELTDNGSYHYKNIDIDNICEVADQPGLSCTKLILVSEENSPPFAELRYTHRQRRAMENVKFLIKQRLDNIETIQDQEADEVYAEAMSHSIKKAQASVAANQLSVVWRLLAYLKPYKKRVIIGMIGGLVMTIVSLMPAYLTGYLIDKVMKPFQDRMMDFGSAMGMTWVIIGGLGFSYLIRTFSMWARLHSMSVLGELVAGDLRHDLYEHMQKLSLGFYSNKQTGSLISRVSSDSDRLWDFIAFGVIEVSLSVLTLLGLGTVLISLDWRLGLLMTLPIPLFIWSFFDHSNKMQRLFLRAWRKWSSMTAVLSDTIPGVSVVKAFNQERREKLRFDGKNDTIINQFNDIHDVWTKFWPFLVMGIHSMTLLVWIFAVPRVFGEGAALTMGTFITFLLYMGMYLQPIETIGMVTRMLNRATSSAHRIFEILDAEPDIVNAESPVVLDRIDGSVEFKDVSFAYDGIRQVISHMSFKVYPGEMIGLVGKSGGGKTTLTSLIARFHEISSGNIYIDGVDIKDIEMGNLRSQIGMVLQDPFLFVGSVLDNIRYGLPNVSVDRVIQAAKTANAHEFISKLPHSYDTKIGERGHTLSGGERQRVSIARAILRNPRILILDEATSSVDTETERKIQDAMDRLTEGRTVFAIAHRLSTLRNADRLFVIDDGRIIEQGTHAELMSIPKGMYNKLQALQQGLQVMYAG